jgi:hypothetical protein
MTTENPCKYAVAHQWARQSHRFDPPPEHQTHLSAVSR